MQISHIQKRWLILILSGLGLCCLPLAWAGDYPEPDGACDAYDLQNKLCFVAGEFTVEVAPDDGNWPIITPGQKKFRYRATWTGTRCTQTSVVLYLIQRFTDCNGYFEATLPAGGVILGDPLPCGLASDPNFDFVKWVPAPRPSCTSGPVYFSILTSVAAQQGCSNLMALGTPRGCFQGYIRGPGCTTIPLETTRNFQPNDLRVDFDPCSGAVAGVFIEGVQSQPQPAWICEEDNVNGKTVTLIDGETEVKLTCYKIKNAGPRSSGCVIESNPNYYLIGNDGYRR